MSSARVSDSFTGFLTMTDLKMVSSDLMLGQTIFTMTGLSASIQELSSPLGGEDKYNLVFSNVGLLYPGPSTSRDLVRNLLILYTHEKSVTHQFVFQSMYNSKSLLVHVLYFLMWQFLL